MKEIALSTPDPSPEKQSRIPGHKYRVSKKQEFCMDAGLKMHANKRAYGNILQTIRRAESLERAIRSGYSREDITKAVASYKQAAARSGPVIVHGALTALGEYGITQGRRV